MRIFCAIGQRQLTKPQNVNKNPTSCHRPVGPTCIQVPVLASTSHHENPNRFYYFEGITYLNMYMWSSRRISLYCVA